MPSIGVFDSGYGGLTVFKAITRLLPDYDYIYLGDNARAPYGDRSGAVILEYTREAVNWFFEKDCPLVILACNTASAKALRSLQQADLNPSATTNRVLGVIRPTAEVIGNYSKTGKVGILGTQGTVRSGAYPDEIAKFFPDIQVYQHACPLWVPFIENNLYTSAGVDYFIEKDLNALFAQSPDIDTLLLACTHYPLLEDKIHKFLPPSVTLLSQGELVAASLKDYLHRHPEMDQQISRQGRQQFFTTDDREAFQSGAALFFGALDHVETAVL